MPKTVSIDPSLVVPWSLDLIQGEPFEYPFTAEYRLGSKRLIYIAALHSCELDSSTFRVIKKIIENDKIELIILEGFGHSLGVSPKKMLGWAMKQDQNGVFDGFETAYAITIAAKNNIPFIGCEPDDSVIYSKSLKHGYSAEDLLFYYFVQQTFQMSEARSNIDNQTLFDDFLKTKYGAFELLKYPTYNDFQTWYLEKNGQPFVPALIDEKVPAPDENGTLFTQRISSSVCKIRDQFILSKIESALNTYDSVLIVCGGSHWSTQKAALEKALGRPSFSEAE